MPDVGSILLVVIAFGIAVLSHELGHFLIAKRCNVRVEKFSIGFGPRLWGFRYGETEYVVSAIRGLGLETNAPRPLLYQVGAMGEALYLCEPPTGYGDTAEKWAGTNAVLARVNFATGLAYGRVPGSKPDFREILKDAPTDDAQALSDWLCRRTLGRPLSARTEEAIAASIEKARTYLKPRQRGRRAGVEDAGKYLSTLILGSPDFQMQ